jgi:hypothetical protein
MQTDEERQPSIVHSFNALFANRKYKSSKTEPSSGCFDFQKLTIETVASF